MSYSVTCSRVSASRVSSFITGLTVESVESHVSYPGLQIHQSSQIGAVETSQNDQITGEILRQYAQASQQVLPAFRTKAIPQEYTQSQQSEISTFCLPNGVSFTAAPESQSSTPPPRRHQTLSQSRLVHQQPYPVGKPVFGRLVFGRRKPEVFSDLASWNNEEFWNGRRIIAFTKVELGDLIQLECSPINSADYRDIMPTISCILFKPNPEGELQHSLAGQCVFTSVDIIGLLERLFDYNKAFDVKEKNRIRRNLESYLPQTIKKEGTTSLFFEQVMKYTQPKCRNIEKDIKVFLWSDISKAMRKIVQQYINKDLSRGRTIPMPMPMSTPLPMNSQASSSQLVLSQNSLVDPVDDYSQRELDLQIQSPSEDYSGVVDINDVINFDHGYDVSQEK
jgi:hypothetical protein